MMATRASIRHVVAKKKVRRKYPPHRLYDTARWKRFRAWYLSAINHRCQASGCAAFATEVHHVRRLADNTDDAVDPAQVEGLCKSCHSKHTAVEVGWTRGGAVEN